MLDYFLQKGYVILKENGEVERTSLCPKDITFKEDENGVIKFYFDYKTSLTPIHLTYE